MSYRPGKDWRLTNGLYIDPTITAASGICLIWGCGNNRAGANSCLCWTHGGTDAPILYEANEEGEEWKRA